MLDGQTVRIGDKTQIASLILIYADLCLLAWVRTYIPETPTAKMLSRLYLSYFLRWRSL